MNSVKLYNGDCLEVMDRLIADGIKVDAIITDPPYGTTACKWDSVIPFDAMWERLKKLRDDNTPIVLFGSEPFTSFLVVSNIKMFKYNWIWEKNKSTGFLNSKKQPLNDHETISVFYERQCVYNPQMTKSDKIYKRGYVVRDKEKGLQQSDNYGEQKSFFQTDNGMRYPKRIQYFDNNFTRNQLHPTQKPVALLEYLIKTYTNEGDTVLDFTMGSGSTGVACVNTNRKFIGIELDETYFGIAKERIEKAEAEVKLSAK